MKTFSKPEIARIAQYLGIGPISEGWTGADPVLPLLERMREDGAIVVIKLDGERVGSDDSGPYTVVASGKPLGGTLIRTDADSLEEALSYLIGNYAEQVWDLSP